MSKVCTECEGIKLIRERFPERASDADMVALKAGWERDGMTVRDMDPDELAKIGKVSESRHILTEQGETPVSAGYTRKDGEIWRRRYLGCWVKESAEEWECGCGE